MELEPNGIYIFDKDVTEDSTFKTDKDDSKSEFSLVWKSMETGCF